MKVDDFDIGIAMREATHHAPRFSLNLAKSQGIS
jgi:hypothetical protein